MRVITGRAKGRRLLTPKSKRIRPALDQVKEAVFNILFDVSELRVLDLFAGTGSMGIEALSRGAAHATFVDDFLSAVLLIKKNLLRCGFTDKAVVIKSPVRAAIRRLSKKGKPFDIIFVDPPYLKNCVNPTLEALARSAIATPSSIIIVEHHPKEPVLPIEGLEVTDSRRYGQTLVTFLKKK
jgi:16S rRNA (guanine(966)-N(2))-methyltransferase RsmD